MEKISPEYLAIIKIQNRLDDAFEEVGHLSRTTDIDLGLVINDLADARLEIERIEAELRDG